MTFAPFRINTGPIFNYLKFLNVTQVFRFETGKFVFKSKNDLLPIDAIAKYFERTISNHNHNLRRRQLPATPFVLLSSFKQKSLYFRGTDMWNSLPETLKLSDSFNIFKKDLKLFLFQNEAG